MATAPWKAKPSSEPSLLVPDNAILRSAFAFVASLVGAVPAARGAGQGIRGR